MNVEASLKARRQSRLGRLSFWVGLVTPVGLVLLLSLLYAANKLTFDHELKNALAGMIILYFFLFAPVLHFAGLALGVVALFRKGKKKLLAGVGVVLNLLVPAAGAAGWLFLIALKAASVVR
jgi:uncharacterized membrane protein YhaH (DUF805 family)